MGDFWLDFGGGGGSSNFTGLMKMILKLIFVMHQVLS